MKAPKFTPGPWEIEVVDDATRVVAYEGDPHLPWVIAEVASEVLDANDDDCQAANAHLIAAAPDLYAACEAAGRALTLIDNFADRDGAIEQIRAALAKARGE